MAREFRERRACAGQLVCFLSSWGAYLLKRGLSRAFAIIAIVSGLSVAKSWSRAQASGATTNSQAREESPEQPNSCLQLVIQQINFPGVPEQDRQMLRNLLPVHEGEVLDREQLQASMRVLFATGRF